MTEVDIDMYHDVSTQRFVRALLVQLLNFCHLHDRSLKDGPTFSVFLQLNEVCSSDFEVDVMS